MRAPVLRSVCMLVVLGLLGAGGASAALGPVLPTEGLGLQHAALQALETTLREGKLYAETTEKTRFFTKDQMLGVLAALEARKARPDQAAFWQQRAIDLWTGAESAFVDQAFYAGTVPAPVGVICIDLQANTWALRAAHALARNGIETTPSPADRVAELRALLASFLAGPTSGGKRLCPVESTSVPLHQRPLLYLALLETSTGSSSSTDAQVRGALRATIAESFDGAFFLPGGLYLASLNAQMVVALTEAARRFNDETLRAARNDVGAWLQNESLAPAAGGFRVRNLAREGPGFVAQPGETPDGQIWAAYALANLARDAPGRVRAGVVEGLVRSYAELYWAAESNGFAGESSLVYADYNLLPAALSQASPLTVTSLDPSLVGFVVPALSTFTYPAPHEPGATSLYISNQWTVRFSMPLTATAPSQVLVAAPALGPFDLGAPVSPFAPAPRLSRTGSGGTADVVVQAVSGDPNLLLFAPQLGSGGNSFRLDAYVPLQPTTAEFGSLIRVFIENKAGQPITVGTLQLELDATDIRIRGATVNNVALATVEVIDPVITEKLPEPHMRVLLGDVPLPIGLTEIALAYTDVTRPQVGAPALTRDLAGRDLIGTAQDDEIQVLQGESVYVRATVRDNGALRSVQLRYRNAGDSVDLRMMPVPGQADVYAVKLPTTGPTGRGIIQVVAIDAAGTGNLNESVPLTIDLRDPLFSGSIVLFVFSGTLCLASFVIWLKVRRRVLR
jgi:hypothetical protein